MKFLTVLLMLWCSEASLAQGNAKQEGDAHWIVGRWEGFCAMSLDNQDGSMIKSYEFDPSGRGWYRHQVFKDNRCKQSKQDARHDFLYQHRPQGPNIEVVTLDFQNVKKGDLIAAEYAFEKIGSGNRMTVSSIYLIEELGIDGSRKTIISSKRGERAFGPGQMYTREIPQVPPAAPAVAPTPTLIPTPAHVQAPAAVTAPAATPAPAQTPPATP